jgi:hypothetical protein
MTTTEIIVVLIVVIGCYLLHDDKDDFGDF